MAGIEAMGRWPVLLLAWLALGPSTADAQVGGDTARVEAVRALRPGATVRLSVSGVRTAGRVEEGVQGRVRLRPLDGGDPVAFDPARLDSLWVRGNAAGAGAATGTLLGLVPVVATCGEDVDECGLVPNGLVVVGVSAAVGYLVGRKIGTWRRILP